MAYKWLKAYTKNVAKVLDEVQEEKIANLGISNPFLGSVG